MILTHSEKALLLEALNTYSTSLLDPAEIGKRMDKENLIKQVQEIKSVDPER